MTMLQGAAELTALVQEWERRLLAIAAQIDAKFANWNFTASEVLPDVKRTAEIARMYLECATTRTCMGQWSLTKGMSTLTEQNKQDAQNNYDELLTLRNTLDRINSGVLKDEYGYTAATKFAPGTPQWLVTKEYLKAPILWLIQIGKPVFQNRIQWSKDLEDIIDTAKNIPQATIKWTLESILRALGLPTWLLPVIGITALVGVGAWAYFSFLAPVGGVGKLVRLKRKNPRRYRRRRRHA